MWVLDQNSLWNERLTRREVFRQLPGEQSNTIKQKCGENNTKRHRPNTKAKIQKARSQILFAKRAPDKEIFQATFGRTIPHTIKKHKQNDIQKQQPDTNGTARSRPGPFSENAWGRNQHQKGTKKQRRINHKHSRRLASEKKSFRGGRASSSPTKYWENQKGRAGPEWHPEGKREKEGHTAKTSNDATPTEKRNKPKM